MQLRKPGEPLSPVDLPVPEPGPGEVRIRIAACGVGYVDALVSLFEKRAAGRVTPFRRVAIETTGLADPAPILHTLLSHEAVRGRFAVDGIVATVDAERESVADAVRDRDELLPTDRDWTARLASRLSAPRRGVFLGGDTIAATAAQKAELHRATGAIAVDMESHRAARAAQRRGLPFAVARVISDAAGRTLPRAARVGMKSDGTVDLPAVLRSLLLAPWQLPARLVVRPVPRTLYRFRLLRLRRWWWRRPSPPGPP